MEKKTKEKTQPKALNSVLLGISLLIFGVFGLLFITQMEVQPGWSSSDLGEIYPVDFNVIAAPDVDGDGYGDLFFYARADNPDERVQYNTPQFGAIYMMNSINGAKIWNKNYPTPVVYASRLADVDGNQVDDFLVSRATVLSSWSGDGSNSLQYVPNSFINEILTATDGVVIPLVGGIDNSFTNNTIVDLININEYNDEYEDIICLQGNYSDIDSKYHQLIVGYFINGTRKGIKDIGTSSEDATIGRGINLPDIESFDYNGESHILYLTNTNITLINRTSANFSHHIYSKQYSFNIDGYTIIKDLTGDSIKEIIVVNNTGTGQIINGANGNIIKEFPLHISVPGDVSGKNIPIKEIPSETTEAKTYIVIDIGKETEGEYNTSTAIFSVTTSEVIKLWEFFAEDRTEYGSIVLGDDFNEDGLNDLMLSEEVRTTAGANSVARHHLLSALTGEELGVLNLQRQPRQPILIPDIDGDNKMDIAAASYEYLMVFSTRIPIPIWLLPEFPLGIPITIGLVAALVGGVYLLLKNVKKVHASRKNLKDNKLTIGVNVIAISLFTISFVMFLGLLNIFNMTMLAGDPLSQVIIIFVLATVIWYGMLPLTAVIYNSLAPRFAILFIKIRVVFFKLSKSNNNEIIVLDLSDRRELGTVNRIKRVILPLLLSIAIGFYVYLNVGVAVFKFPVTFSQFGGTEFFKFIAGYNLFCTVPMIITFALFSFLISGNYLLDDAGVVYYLESRRYRKPGDIEPISIWSQSFIKGIAGFSALFTFGSFFLNVNFSGFFREEGMMAIFGVFMVVVMFWGQPFLTSFAFILLAVEIMDQSVEENTKKLYKKMEEEGFDTTPHTLTKLYPDGYIQSEKMKQEFSLTAKLKRKTEKKEKKKEPKEVSTETDNSEPINT